MTRLDPRHPLVFDTRELGRRAGAMVEISRIVEAPEPVGTDVAVIEEGSPLDFELRFESVVEGVLVSGSVRATAIGACVRCLEPVDVAVDATFQELFAYPDRAAHHHEVGAQDDTDDYELEGDLLDLGPVLRDAIVPALPFQPLCREDCPGLCVECGARLEDDPTHRHETIDPRWAALAELTQVGPTGAEDEEKES